MKVAKHWELLPNVDLSERGNWRQIEKNQYSALRARLLIVRSKGSQSRFGPATTAYTINPGDTITKKRKRVRVLSHTETISEAIRFKTMSRICDQLSAKVSTELSVQPPGFKGKLQSELMTRTEYEISDELEDALTTTTSHLIQEAEEVEHTITLNGKSVVCEAQLRRRYWPSRWDVYLHSFEYLELTYRKTWPWRKVRESIKYASSGVLGWPLSKIVIFEPQDDEDVRYDTIEDELTNPESVHVEPLYTPMPRSRSPEAESLEQLAQLAFPVTHEERKAAAKRKSKRKAAKRKAKKKVAKRKAVRKAAKRKTKRKAAKRKAAKRKVKKKATKRKAVRKAAKRKTKKKAAKRKARQRATRRR